jgi:hypothetical protein
VKIKLVPSRSYSFIYFLTKSVLNAYYVPGTMLSARDAILNQYTHNTGPHEPCSLVREMAIDSTESQFSVAMTEHHRLGKVQRIEI